MKRVAAFVASHGNALLALVFRLYLGGLFIYASIYKIMYPAVFAQSVANYQLVPEMFVGLMAVTLPWMELVCGVLLVVGVRGRSACVMIAAMLTVFMLALVWALVMDIPIGCGCFDSQEAEVGWRTVLRDLGWLLMAAHVYFRDSLFHLENRFSWMIGEEVR
ncbi:putative membrane protein YphA (DoxX/SURF4 family) [Desulfobaculum xiamenense]|uniref:Putative membrane protein YphA (DoxX/SURF4 family) n=1 Tax=Desulfobaculum xiamenense TaxID=995050 RepID=A0A846QHA1_9BACT|nr:MauE/DoxX family redox-associated membrane protein [Desulfobaculum xiamenense]NJB66377.1 putative membrane protein YphA (DoxX/SURF4 family) [Desulfobaculum xiamenense]